MCGTFDIKSNYFGPLIPKKLKSFLKLDIKRLMQNRVSMNRSKTTSLRPNIGAASLKSEADALSV